MAFAVFSASLTELKFRLNLINTLFDFPTGYDDKNKQILRDQKALLKNIKISQTIKTKILNINRSQ